MGRSPGRVGLGARATCAAFACAALGLLAACGTEEPAPRTPALRFLDATARSGLALEGRAGNARASTILEVKGGGLALIDYDGDGLLDLFAPGGGTLASPERGTRASLWRNLGGLRFEDASNAAGLVFDRWGQGVAVGDVDGDGADDIFVACFGRDALLRNRGAQLLEDTAAGEWGEAWSSAASFGDLDGDGDLDLYVTRYLVFDPRHPPPPTTFLGVEVFAGPMGLEPAPDAVYRNRGDGSFEDATAEWGFDAPAPSYGLGVTILDLDGDGAPEVFVGNDSAGNFLFRRSEGGAGAVRFVELGLASGVALSEEGAGQATMGIAVADVTGDGRADLFTTNFMADTNTLHVQRAPLLFEDRTRGFGLALESRPFVGWGALFADLDHDGDEDLVLVNGHVYPDRICEPQGWQRRQTPLLFERDGPRFARVPAEVGGAWLAATHQDRGLVAGDLDRDGDLDLVVIELDGPARVLENVGARGSWLVVGLADRRPGAMNRRGIGARLELEAGALSQVRWIASGLSYQSSTAPEAHFGLGAHEGPLTLRVRWPDGFEQRVGLEGARRTLVVERSQ